MQRRTALDVALDMVQRPLLARQAQEQPLPDDVLHLIRIAADSEEDLVWASCTRARARDDVREAAVMFLQQILFHPRADNFRLLGLGPNAGLEDLQEHRRWLLKWLHPDRNHDKWESQLFRRVVQASGELQRQLSESPSQIVPASEPQSSRRSRRNKHRPRSAQFATKPDHRSSRIKRYTRRGCYAVVTIALVVIAWQVWNGQSIGQSLADLSDGHGSWMDW